MLLDLTGDLYTFGRGETCDYQFSTDSALMKQCYQAYSKVHFKVTKVMCFVCSFSPTKRQWRETSIDGALLHFFSACRMTWKVVDGIGPNVQHKQSISVRLIRFGVFPSWEWSSGLVFCTPSHTALQFGQSNKNQRKTGDTSRGKVLLRYNVPRSCSRTHKPGNFSFICCYMLT